AASWRADALPRERSGRSAPRHGAPEWTPEARLGHRRQYRDRFSMGFGRRRLDTICRRAVCASSAGRDPSHRYAGGEDNAAVDPHGFRIFIAGSDPVVDGLVMSLARPGGNLTGLYVFEPSIGAKLLELLKEIAPHVARAAILFNPDAKAASWVAAAAAVAPRFAVEVIEAPVRDSNEIEAAIAQWGRQPNYGLIVLPDPHRKLINELAARYRLPAIHALSGATRDGGLMSYGVDLPDVFRQAAAYADRILKGDKPADLPVQLPTKFELAINLKTS